MLNVLLQCKAKKQNKLKDIFKAHLAKKKSQPFVCFVTVHS